LPLRGRHEVAYWSEEGYDRTELVALVIAYLNERGWGKAIDSGWSDWDVEVYCHPWTIVEAGTAQEEHGGGRHLIRGRYRLRPTGHVQARGLGGLLALVAAAWWPFWTLAGGGLLLVALCGCLWCYGTRRASRVVSIFDVMGQRLGLIRCAPAPAVPAAPPAGPRPVPVAE